MISSEVALEDLRAPVSIAVTGNWAAHSRVLEPPGDRGRLPADRTSEAAAANREKTMQARNPPAPRFFQLVPYCGTNRAATLVIERRVRKVSTTPTRDNADVAQASPRWRR